jgi:hypothetical protein
MRNEADIVATDDSGAKNVSVNGQRAKQRWVPGEIVAIIPGRPQLGIPAGRAECC